MSKNDPHILGKESIGKLLLQYSIPAIIGMTITSIYNIIDSIFIGHGVGAMAIAGLAVSFPLMNLVVAFCTLVSAGGSTIASIRLGQKDMKGATEILSHTLMLCITNSFFFGILSFIFLDDILTFFGASPDTLPYARSFMQVILLGTPITYTMIGLNNVMRATGYPKKAMLTSMVTVVANIILAPIFIFHFEWGMRGAATATVISQLIGMVWVVSHFCKKDSTVHFEGKVWKMKGRIVESIFAIGMSPFLMNVCACAIVIVINNSLFAGTRRRHGYRCLRNHQPVADALCHDRTGTDDGYAADCRLQLRSTEDRPGETDAKAGNYFRCSDYKQRFSDLRVFPSCSIGSLHR